MEKQQLLFVGDNVVVVSKIICIDFSEARISCPNRKVIIISEGGNLTTINLTLEIENLIKTFIPLAMQQDFLGQVKVVRN